MSSTTNEHPELKLLGIEGGGTRTVALYQAGGQTTRLEAPACNLRLTDDTKLIALLQSIAVRFPKPDALGIGLAGARTPVDKSRVLTAVERVWPGIPSIATNDLDTGLAAAIGLFPDANAPRLLVLSGTGSCCYAKISEDTIARSGGWGHILGDGGSAHDIGMRSLRECVSSYDHTGTWPTLGQRILRQLQLISPEQLIQWAQNAAKDEVASLAVETFEAADAGDKMASQILDAAAAELARDAIACARKLVGPAAPRKIVQFALAGGALLKQPQYAARLSRLIRKTIPRADIKPLHRESAWGAIELAYQAWVHAGKQLPASTPAPAPPPKSKPRVLSLTEERNPRSMNLDKLTLAQGIRLMLSEDQRLPGAILKQASHIEKALRLIVATFKRGGRLFYVGAGTSGRLGILDASECPPTFRTPAEMVQGIIAGGQPAIWLAVEGAEDDTEAGRKAIAFRGITAKDMVIGIAASGSTPFVWGALDAAREKGAHTGLVCFNPRLEIDKQHLPEVVICVASGAEILTGSTRLKAGTATKMILNILTTLSMVKMGKAISNLMVDVNASNIKLRDRAIRITCQLTGVSPEQAQVNLEKHGWIIKSAVKDIGRLRRSK
jgi:N-acetylmuramic acid 6-phosphate etherase